MEMILPSSSLVTHNQTSLPLKDMESSISVKNWEYGKADLLYGIWAKNKFLLVLEDMQR